VQIAGSVSVLAYGGCRIYSDTRSKQLSLINNGDWMGAQCQPVTAWHHCNKHAVVLLRGACRYSFARAVYLKVDSHGVLVAATRLCA
jgi:hypothetical protein